MAKRSPYVALRCGDATASEQWRAAEEIERLQCALNEIACGGNEIGMGNVLDIAQAALLSPQRTEEDDG